MANAARPAAIDATSEGRLSIARLTLRVATDPAQAPPDMPGPVDIAHAVDDALATALDHGDRSFWVVRRLRIAASVGDTSRAAIGGAIALSLRAAIGKVLRGELVDGVMRYADRTDWLAALLWDHARGMARGHWAYARYGHLDALPLAMIARQLFVAEPFEAMPVLARLHAQGRLVPFAAAIGEAGARGLLAQIAATTPGPADDNAARRIAERIMRVARTSSLPVTSQRALLVGVGGFAETTGRPARATLLAVRSIAAGMAARPSEGAALRDDRPDSDNLASQPATSEHHATRRDGGETDGAQAVDAIDTPLAGIILLWRSVRALELETLFPAGAAAGHAALTLAATMAGPQRRAAWRDPALHWLTGFVPGEADRPIPPDPAMAERFAAHLATRALPAAIETFEQRSGGLRIVQDGQTEDWIALAVDRSAARLVPGRRDPARDIAFFGIARAPRRRVWALLARAAYADLARRLTGLDRSSAAWLWANVLGGWGRIEPGMPARLVMPRVPLDLVLRMTGLDGMRFSLEDGRTIDIQLPGRG